MPDDSFNYAKEIEHLENAGVNPSEAKAIVGMAERAVNSGAQKSDIVVLNGKIELLNGKIDAEIKSVRSDIALLHKDIQHLNEKVNANYTDLNTKINNVHTDLNTKINNVHTALDTKIDNVHTDLDTKINNVHTALDTKIDSNQAFYIAEMKAAISRSTNLILTCILASVIGVFSIFFAFFG
ncbi:MAG: DUF1640 domain-containing protein [Aestuariivita sp.]|nr:DUF1640 domain-containing protein [Aestuariivita sp.]